MAVTTAVRVARPRWWPAVAAWALWMLTMLGLAATLWLRQLLVNAGRPELMTFDPLLVVAMVSAATAGAVVASRRPAHPVGWLLLAFTVLLVATGVAAAYGPYGLLARPGALPAAGFVAVYYPPFAVASLACLALVLLLTPDRVAALCALALVGLDQRGRAGRLPAGGDAWAQAVARAVPAAGQPVRLRRLRRGRAGDRPAGPGGHLPGHGGGGRVTGGALPSGPRGGAPAAALGGARGRAGGGRGGARPGRPGAGDLGAARLGDHAGVRGLAAGGHRCGDLALSAVRPGPHHQPHPGLRAAYGAAGIRLCRGGARAGSAAARGLQPGGGGRHPDRGCGGPA